ncbi:MAG: tetratricopeptide repeat protein, partial [Aurantibacter sp.]
MFISVSSMRRVLTFFLFFTISLETLPAQSADSLKQLLEQSSISVAKQVELNQQLAKYYERSNRDSALIYINEAERLFDTYQNDSLHFQVINHKVQLLVLQRKTEEAESLLSKIEAIIGNDTIGIQYANLLFQRGNIHLNQQEFDLALNYYLKGL